MLVSILTSLTEVMVLTVTVMLLYSYRYIIGAAGVYLMAGIFFMFTLLTDSPRFSTIHSTTSFFSTIGSGLLWLPSSPSLSSESLRVASTSSRSSTRSPRRHTRTPEE